MKGLDFSKVIETNIMDNTMSLMSIEARLHLPQPTMPFACILYLQ